MEQNWNKLQFIKNNVHKLQEDKACLALDSKSSEPCARVGSTSTLIY